MFYLAFYSCAFTLPSHLTISTFFAVVHLLVVELPTDKLKLIF